VEVGLQIADLYSFSLMCSGTVENIGVIFETASSTRIELGHVIEPTENTGHRPVRRTSPCALHVIGLSLVPEFDSGG